MVEGTDYGKIPGTNKPTLLKPGAEKLGVMFRLDPQFQTTETYHPDGHLTVKTYCTIHHAPTGQRLGGSSAICSTREGKYAWRKADRVCPSCGKPAIIKGKAEYGGGWLCWKKKDGCGLQYAEDDAAITGQPVGRVPNPDVADCFNTVLRIAEKRAFVAAMRLVTGASAIFDEEAPAHEPHHDDHHETATPPPAKPAAPKPTPPDRNARLEQFETACKVVNAVTTLDDLKTFCKHPPLPRGWLDTKDQFYARLMEAIDAKKFALTRGEIDRLAGELGWDDQNVAALAHRLGTAYTDKMSTDDAAKLLGALEAEEASTAAGA
jgi:hypothetical protein